MVLMTVLNMFAVIILFVTLFEDVRDIKRQLDDIELSVNKNG